MFLFRGVSHLLSLPLSSCLGCIPPLIGLPLLRSLLRSGLCGCLLFVSSVCDFVYVFGLLLIATMSFLATFLSVLFCLLSLLISEHIPGLIWFGSVYLVTSTGFLADLLMCDKQQHGQHNMDCTRTFYTGGAASTHKNPLEVLAVDIMYLVHNFWSPGSIPCMRKTLYAVAPQLFCLQAWGNAHAKAIPPFFSTLAYPLESRRERPRRPLLLTSKPFSWSRRSSKPGLTWEHSF